MWCCPCLVSGNVGYGPNVQDGIGLQQGNEESHHHQRYHRDTGVVEEATPSRSENQSREQDDGDTGDDSAHYALNISKGNGRGDFVGSDHGCYV